MQMSLDELVLAKFPYPIAVGYRALLDAPDGRTRVERAIDLFDYGMRILALGVVSQYLTRDADQVSDPLLNRLLYEKLPKPSLGTWKQILFQTLRAYGGRRDLFFIPELYDLYWDTARHPEEPRAGIQAPYDRLIEIRNDIVHGPKPTTAAEWQSLSERVLGYLQQVLPHFEFLQEYTLVRILEKQDNRYTAMMFKGEYPSRLETPIVSEALLELGRFYITRDFSSFLELHPWILFWPDMFSVAQSSDPTNDTGMFHVRGKTSVTYLLVAIQRLVQEPSVLGEFARLIDYTLQTVKQYRREANRLTWDLLREVTSEISKTRFGDVREKYRADLYLQRDEIKHAFSSFLASDMTAFLLLGKSGVGKSNFLVSLAEEVQNSEKFCFLFYNGAKLTADRPLSQTLGQDFEKHIRLRSQRGERLINDALYEISQVQGIEERQVVLVIDAVNENAEAKSLLRRIDEIVDESNLYPWLKLVFSSRPEAWRAMKRGLRLSEHRYYRQSEREELGVELKGFAVGVEIGRFTKEELPTAYKKYQDAYHIQTAYEAISPELRQLLNDPLTLRLVAEIHKEQSIPKQIRPGEIYQKYVARLISDDRLDARDMVFLEEELMPLMINETTLENAITADQVNSTTLSDGRHLIELIHDDYLLQTNRRINQSFRNLVDAEILVRQGDPVDYEIGFKYERFFEYYAGKRLFVLAKAESNPRQYFIDLIALTAEKPYLWGVVRTALLMMTSSSNKDLVLELAYTTDQRRKELVASVLITYGADSPKEAEDIVMQLLGTSTRTRRSKASDRKTASELEVSPEARYTANKIAVEVASELGFQEVLGQALRHPVTQVRVIAIQFAYYLWRRNPEKGFEILERIARDVRGRFGIPNTQALEVCVGYSTLIMFDNYKNDMALNSLKRIWKKLIQSILPIGSGMAGGFVADRLKSVIVFVGARMFARLIRTFPDYSLLNVAELNYFFQVRKSKERLWAQLIPFIDPEYGTDQDLAPLLEQGLVDYHDMFSTLLVGSILFGRLIKKEQETLPTIRRIYDTLEEQDPISVSLNAVGWPMTYALYRQNPPGELLDLFEKLCWHLHESSRGRYWTELRQYNGLSGTVSPYVLFYERSHGGAFPPRLERAIEKAAVKMDAEFAQQYYDGTVELGAYAGYIKSALHAVEQMLQYPGTAAKKFQIEGLARMRTFYPDEVDDFLEQHDFTDADRDQIKIRTLPVAFGDLFVLKGPSFAINALIIESPQLRAELQWAFQAWLKSTDLNQLLELLFMKVTNLVYGEELFVIKVT